MNIVEQYEPQKPKAGNALHEMQLERMVARAEADAAWKGLKQHVTSIVHPEPAKPKSSFVENLAAHAGTIAVGVQLGMRIISAIRGRKG